MAPKNDSNAGQSTLLWGSWFLAHSVGGLLHKVIAAAGLKGDEFGFTSVIHRYQPVTPAQISEMTGMPPTTVSSYLNRLEARGLVTRRRNPDDGRSFLVEFTPEGLKTHVGAWERFVPAQKAVEENLDMPVEEAVEVLRKITEAVLAASEPLEPRKDRRRAGF